MLDIVWVAVLFLILCVIAGMKNAIKKWMQERWIRLISKVVVNQIIVQPVEYYPKGLVCSHCIELESMRPHGWPIPSVNGADSSGDSPRRAGQSLSYGAHAFGCPCAACQAVIDERLDEFEAVKALVFDIFGDLFPWHTKKEA